MLAPFPICATGKLTSFPKIHRAGAAGTPSVPYWVILGALLDLALAAERCQGHSQCHQQVGNFGPHPGLRWHRCPRRALGAQAAPHPHSGPAKKKPRQSCSLDAAEKQPGMKGWGRSPRGWGLTQHPASSGCPSRQRPGGISHRSQLCQSGFRAVWGWGVFFFTGKRIPAAGAVSARGGSSPRCGGCTSPVLVFYILLLQCSQERQPGPAVPSPALCVRVMSPRGGTGDI